MHNKVLTFTFIISLAISLNVLAHEERVHTTEVIFNDNTNLIEIMHRLSVHDIEHFYALFFNDNIDLLTSIEDTEAIAKFVVDHFSLDFFCSDSICNSSNVQYVGSEIDRGYFWVYQEIGIPKDLTRISVSNSLFMELWEGQVNMLSIDINDKFNSYVLNKHLLIINLVI